MTENGWIPVTERLPKERVDCLVTVQYTGFMGMHGKWVKTGHLESGGEWWGDCMGGRVIAWQPLPAPYRPATEQDKQKHMTSVFLRDSRL